MENPGASSDLKLPERPEHVLPAVENEQRAAVNERPAKRRREGGPWVADSDGVYKRLGPEVTEMNWEDNKQREPDDFFWDASGMWEKWYGKWYNPELDVWWHLRKSEG
jgi:hypothetical protein